MTLFNFKKIQSESMSLFNTAIKINSSYREKKTKENYGTIEVIWYEKSESKNATFINTMMNKNYSVPNFERTKN